MLPVVAIIGCPNVGKSTLFNRLTRTVDALVVDLPGTTRDRKYGEGKIGSQPYLVVDTGGMGLEDNAVDNKMVAQAWQAVLQADVILLLVDGKHGLTAADIDLANKLRTTQKHVLLIVNKIDGRDQNVAVAEFFALGINDPIPIAASHGRGIKQLVEQFIELFPATEQLEDLQLQDAGIKVAIVGKPNVGKSTLVNRILGHERVIVFDKPGTTRDSIFIPMERDERKYTLIDTAGVRKKGKIKELVEKFSIIKTLQAIEASDVVVLVIDAQQGVTDRDLSLLEFIIAAGRCLVIAINKWDGLTTEHRDEIKKTLSYKINFAYFAKQHFISALHGTGVGNLFTSIIAAYESATRARSTPQITRILEELVNKHMPSMVSGKRIKLRYAHVGGYQPLKIIVHGNKTAALPRSYQRYLVNGFQKKLKLVGTLVRLEFRTGDNPYSGKRNKLTPRQIRKQKRIRERK